MSVTVCIPLRVLIVEDNEDDALLLLRDLRRGGYDPVYRRVDTPEAFDAALAENEWDIVLSDYTMPRFSGTAALERLRAQGHDTPFIFVSGTIGEETAVAAMRAGAQDYVTKGNLKRLPAAIARELHEATLRREHRQALAERRVADARFRNILTIAPDAIIAVNEDQRIELFNNGAARTFGYTEEEVLGQPLDMLIPERSAAAHREHLCAFLRGQEVTRAMNERGEIAGRRKDGSEFPAEASISKVIENGRIVCTVMLHDITLRKQADERMQYLAHHDTLTGLPNRVLFQDRLHQRLIESGRHGRCTGVVFLDLDRFKIINDSLGHRLGDLLLGQVAERISACVRTGDTVARLAGDQFALLLADMRHPDDGALVARKILGNFTQPFYVAEHKLFASASLGMAFYPGDYTDVEGLMRGADIALHRAKESGGNTWLFCAAEMTGKAQQRLALENALRNAVERREFLLHYQPQVALDDGRIDGVEALVRWQHPERGLVAPGEFIGLAEETGLIVPLGEWVLHTACEQFRTRNGSGSLRIAVNISPRQFRQPGLLDMIVTILERTGFDASALELEITESLLLHDADAALDVLRRLGELGVQFSVDDFGTGYSSLAYLRHLPIGTIKIDQSFVRGLPADPNNAAIVNAIISMAHDLGLRVIAEGVETAAQLEFLRERNCDHAQGFYFSRPRPREELAPLLENVRMRPN